ncbi:MAG: conjugal transfer protein TraG [Hyphomonas sp. 34-62-18]|nr:conjugal transfer protein TraG [Hyphomonas sp. 34-62-18]OZB19398.1 MAG: conjugal transfer protein TraG [Hyphomonas sp. 34-62-18]
MTGTRILIGQILIVLAIVFFAHWLATQITAQALGNQPALGAPWFVVGERPVYKPWRLYQWWYAYDAYAPDVFARGGAITLGGSVLGIIAAVIGSLLRSRHERNVTTYGSARWAKYRDLKHGRLIGNDGVFVGRWKNHYLRHAGPEHVMAFAPTRSGKGVGLVVPTLLSWTDSVLVHDIKGENWSITSGWRSTFSTCIRFDPTDRRSPRYNPLMAVRKGEHEVRDVQNIADILVDPEGSLERRSHWEKTGHALLVGVILHVLYAEQDKTLSGCATFLSDPKRPFSATLRAMMQTRHLGAEGVHPVVAQSARELMNKSENERSGVLSTAMSFLALYRDPVIAEVTSRSDWRIEDLVEAERPVSLFLVVPPSDLSRTKSLMRLILNQVGRRLTEELPQASGRKRRQLLLMLDEFPALGRLDFFESALAFMAGYGLRSYLITQSLNQIEKAYGPNNSILDNCHIRIAFATNDERTARRISDAIGTTTELRSQRNFTGHRLAPWLSHVMVSRQETQRPLITTGEVMQLSPHDEIVLASGTPPVRAKKLRYYKDRNFTSRVLPETSVALASPLGAPSTWKGVIAPPVAPRARAGASVEGPEVQLVLQPELDLEPTQADETPASVVEPEHDESADPAGDKHLDTIRRAVGLDRADPDFLPDF